MKKINDVSRNNDERRNNLEGGNNWNGNEGRGRGLIKNINMRMRLSTLKINKAW